MDSQDQDLGHDSSSRDRPEDITTYDSGIGRPYECVFCKRGFATAQALGGHMNIHRKDRANPKLNPCASSSINHEPGFPSNRRLSSQVDFHQFLTPPNMPSSSNPRFPMDASQNVLLRICCKEKWCSSSLGLHIGVASSDVVGEIRKRKSSQVGLNIHQQAVEEVDLELRLGHLKP